MTKGRGALAPPGLGFAGERVRHGGRGRRRRGSGMRGATAARAQAGRRAAQPSAAPEPVPPLTLAAALAAAAAAAAEYQLHQRRDGAVAFAAAGRAVDLRRQRYGRGARQNERNLRTKEFNSCIHIVSILCSSGDGFEPGQPRHSVAPVRPQARQASVTPLPRPARHPTGPALPPPPPPPPPGPQPHLIHDDAIGAPLPVQQGLHLRGVLHAPHQRGRRPGPGHGVQVDGWGIGRGGCARQCPVAHRAVAAAGPRPAGPCAPPPRAAVPRSEVAAPHAVRG
jgi:hypothetical protein